jgi:hypothetical protein
MLKLNCIGCFDILNNEEVHGYNDRSGRFEILNNEEVHGTKDARCVLKDGFHCIIMSASIPHAKITVP